MRHSLFRLMKSSSLALLLLASACEPYSYDALKHDFNWEIQNSAADYMWAKVREAPELGLLIAIARSGSGKRVMTSSDGKAWALQDTPADHDWYGLAWSGSLGLAVATAHSGDGNRIMTSPDAENWTLRKSPHDNWWVDIRWIDELEKFVSVAMSGDGNQAMTSTDGKTWTAQATPDAKPWHSFAWSPTAGLLVALGAQPLKNGGNRLMVSADGETWIVPEDQSGIPNARWQDVVWAPWLDLYVAVAYDGETRVMTSPNGKRWTGVNAPMYQWTAITAGNGYLVAASTDGHIMTSKDAIHWKVRSSQAANEWEDVTWAPGLSMFVAVAQSGDGDRVLISQH